ncbi:MAG: cation:proton antiporter [Candidatus Aenigmatarchaeota archaeon]
MVDATLIVAIAGLVAVLGYASNWIFERTRIPDALWLILFGVVIAWLGPLPASAFIAFTPALVALAAAVIGFEFGLYTDVRTLMHGLPRTTVLAVTTMVLSTIGVALVAHALLGLDFIRSLLLGAMISNVSSIPVKELIYKVRMREELRNFLHLEAVISDMLCFTVAVMLIGAYTAAAAPNPLQAIGGGLLISVAMGAAIGAVRLAGSRFVKGKPYNYVLTLGLALVGYAAADWLGGIAGITVLVYGLMLANARKLPRSAGALREQAASPFLKKFYSEVSLFMRSFFFVFLGAAALGAFDERWWYGIAILITLILLRMPAVEFSLVRKSVTRQELWIMKGMVPKDLSVVVLVMLAISKGVAGAEGWLGISFFVVLGSLIYATAMTLIIMREQLAARSSKPVAYESLPQRKLWKKFGA